MQHVRESGFEADRRFRARVAQDGAHSRRTVGGKTLCESPPTERDIGRSQASGLVKFAALAKTMAKPPAGALLAAEEIKRICPACLDVLIWEEAQPAKPSRRRA